VRERAVAAYAEDHRVLGPGDLPKLRAERAVLVGADRREIHRVKQQHDLLLPAEIAQLHLVLVLVHQLAIRRDIAGLQGLIVCHVDAPCEKPEYRIRISEEMPGHLVLLDSGFWILTSVRFGYEVWPHQASARPSGRAVRDPRSHRQALPAREPDRARADQGATRQDAAKLQGAVSDQRGI